MYRYLAWLCIFSSKCLFASAANQGDDILPPLLPPPTYWTSLQKGPPVPSYMHPPGYVEVNPPCYEEAKLQNFPLVWVPVSPRYCLLWPFEEIALEEWENDGSIVAVMNLGPGACAHELFEIFSEWGEVQQVKLEMRSEEEVVKGIALIKFRKVAHAEEVCKQMHGFEYNYVPLEIYSATVLVVGRDIFALSPNAWSVD